MLKWVGHEAAAVLDGGLQAWQAAGGELASTVAVKKSKKTAFSRFNYALASELSALVAINTVVDNLQKPSQTIIDARGAPRYRGEVEPLDPVAGHIPGALNRPFSDNIGADGKFKPADVLKAEFTNIARRPRPNDRRPPLRQRRQRRAQCAGDADCRIRHNRLVCGQLERVVQRR